MTLYPWRLVGGSGGGSQGGGALWVEPAWNRRVDHRAIRSLTHLLRTARFAHALRWAHSFARSHIHSPPSSWKRGLLLWFQCVDFSGSGGGCNGDVLKTVLAVMRKKIYQLVTWKAVFMKFGKATVMHDGSSGGSGDSSDGASGGGGLGIRMLQWWGSSFIKIPCVWLFPRNRKDAIIEWRRRWRWRRLWQRRLWWLHSRWRKYW